MQAIHRFRKKYRKHLLHLWVEENLGWLIRNIPGFIGFVIRGFIYRFLFSGLQSFPLIYSGDFFSHSYGIDIGRDFSINTGAHLDGRGRIKIENNVMIGQCAVIGSGAAVVSDVSDYSIVDGVPAEVFGNNYQK